jgi:hypothetical protein
MISIRIAVSNPFKHKPFKDYWQREYLITKHKCLEIGFYRYAWDLFEFHLDLRWSGRDHAGPSIEIGILGYTARLGISDTRHWNSVENRWENYEQENLL